MLLRRCTALQSAHDHDDAGESSGVRSRLDYYYLSRTVHVRVHGRVRKDTSLHSVVLKGFQLVRMRSCVSHVGRRVVRSTHMYSVHLHTYVPVCSGLSLPITRTNSREVHRILPLKLHALAPAVSCAARHRCDHELQLQHGSLPADHGSLRVGASRLQHRCQLMQVITSSSQHNTTDGFWLERAVCRQEPIGQVAIAQPACLWTRTDLITPRKCLLMSM